MNVSLRAMAVLAVCLIGLSGVATAQDVARRQMTPMTAATIGVPSRWTCDDAALTPPTFGVSEALPGAWRNPQRYGTGWDIRYSEDRKSATLTWFTFDQRGRPVWYQSTAGAFDAPTQTWRSDLYRTTYSDATGLRSVPEAVGAVSMRVLEDKPGEVALRWALNDRNVAATEECVYDYFNEGSRTAAERSERLTLEGSRRFELMRTRPSADLQGGERLTLLSFDQSGAPTWTTAYAAANTLDVPTSYLRSTYEAGLGLQRCAEASCVVRKPAGTIRRSSSSRELRYGLAVSVTDSTTSQVVNDRYPAVDTVPALAQRLQFSVTATPNPCTVAPSSGVPNFCSVTITWQNAPTNVLVLSYASAFPVQVGSGGPNGSIQVSLPPGLYYYQIREATPFGPGDAYGVLPVEVLVGETYQPFNIGVGDAATCRTPGAPPVLPGDAPGVPGRWYNPKRSRTGWDFFFTSSSGGLPSPVMIAQWYTFDRNGEPVWLFAPTMQIGTVVQNGQSVKVATGPLVEYRWTGSAADNGRTVGELSIAFPHDDPTRANIRWRWTEALAVNSSVPYYEECIGEISRYSTGANAPAKVAVNQAFTGTWYEPARSGYGLGMYYATPDSGTVLDEYMSLGLYNTQGLPR